jgi:phosphate transport system protein
MERHFEQELEKLNRRILKMGNLVAEQIGDTMRALTNCDTDLARQIIENDNKLDELDVKIDKLCQRIFALTQPVATDLRLIMSALKMNNDLERMGDHAVTIAEKIEGIIEYREIIDELGIRELAEKTDILVKDVINILNSRNLTFIRDIFTDSAALKDATQVVSARIIEQMMAKQDIIIVATHLMIIITQIERIADYSNNIAESIIFLVEGKMVKHSHLDEGKAENPGNASQPGEPPAE